MKRRGLFCVGLAAVGIILFICILVVKDLGSQTDVAEEPTNVPAEQTNMFEKPTDAPTGQSQNAAGDNNMADNKNNPGYISNPEITITNGHEQKIGESYAVWMGETFYVMGNYIKIPGNGFAIDVKFDRSLDTESVLKNVKVSGPGKVNIDTRSMSVLYINCPDAKPGDTFTLNIMKDIKDAEGNTLEKDMKIEIDVVADTLAHFTLSSSEYPYEMDDYALAEYVYITDSPKTITVDFTGDVNKESVEKSITDELSLDNVKCNFTWLDDRRFQLDISNFPQYKNFKISMDKAVDTEGFKIIGWLNLYSGKPTNLGFIDMDTKKPSIIKEMTEKRYMALENESIGRYVILDDGTIHYVFDLEEHKITKKYNGGTTWIDSDRTLLLDYVNKKIFMYSLQEDSKKEVCDLSFIPVERDVRMYSISPDGKKIAVTIDVNEQGYNGKGDLYIFSIDGEMLYEYKDIVNVRPVKVLPELNDMVWLDNRNIILENNEDNSNLNYSLIKVDIETGKKETILKNAVTPVVLAGKNIFIAPRCNGVSGWTVVLGGKEIATLKLDLEKYPEGCELRNFIFLDGEHTVFNRNDDIVLYNIETMKEEILGNGYIFGVSEDKRKVYFITNYRDLDIYY